MQPWQDFFCARSQEVMLTYIFILMSNKKSNWEIVERDTLVIISWGRYTSYRNLIMPFSELFIRLVPCMMKLKAQYTHRSGNTEMHSLDKEGLVHGRVWGLPLSALTSGMGCISYFCCFLLGSEFLGNDAFCTSKLSTVLKKLLFLIKKKRKKKGRIFPGKDHRSPTVLMELRQIFRSYKPIADSRKLRSNDKLYNISF